MSFDHVSVFYGSDIWSSSCTSIVVTTNSVGAMGAGLAKQAAQRYPQLVRQHRALCNSAKPGELHAVFVEPVSASRNIILLPTKLDWRNPSRVEYIEAGLQWLVGWSSNLGSIALPPLGCGLGGLNFQRDLRPLLIEYLPRLDWPVELYLPSKEVSNV